MIDNPDIIVLDEDDVTYKVGDYCYFDSDPSLPYTIKKIEEIIREDKNQVQCKVQSFSRRRDIPNGLQQLADKHVRDLEQDLYESQWNDLDDLKRHQLQYREVYMARTTGADILPISQIRGKCNVTLLSATDNFVEDYLETENTHFYTLVYDQNQRTVVTDRGDIRVGPNFQCLVPETLSDTERENYVDGRKLEELEELVFDGDQLATYIEKTKAEDKIMKQVQKSDNDEIEPEETVEDDLDRLIVLGKSVGLFARALDATASTVQPILQVSACMASRDSTLQWAMDCMHNSGYDLGQACRLLVSKQGPILVRDQLESWSPSEAQLFEDGVDRYGKEFSLVRSEYLPWKTYTSIIEFYYMWKASDRYLSYKKNKFVEIEKKMTEFGITKSYLNQATVNSSEQFNDGPLGGGNKPCEGCCCEEAETWYKWKDNFQYSGRLCDKCWVYWKKYGGLKIPQSLRVELMQNKHKKPGVNDEKKGSLRVSTQMNTVEAELKRKIEKEKKKTEEEKRKTSTSQDEENEPIKVEDSQNVQEDSPETEATVEEDKKEEEETVTPMIDVTDTMESATPIIEATDSMDTAEDIPAKKARVEE